MHVEQFCGVKNQFVIVDGNRRIFQSYRSIIAVIEYVEGKRVVTLDKHRWNYSRTTSKYLSLFLEEPCEVIGLKIRNGTYETADLNTMPTLAV